MTPETLNNIEAVSEEVEKKLGTTKTQWGRLISCLPQLSSVDLLESTLKLGRSDECDIVIHRSKFLPTQLFYVSKEHFLLTKDPQDMYITYITDLSKNGTYINGRLIGRNKKIILQNNDAIAIGDKLQVYVFKSMNYAVSESYLPKVLHRKYEPSRLLGEGACGEVRLVYEKLTCKSYAIKKIAKGRNTPSQENNINHPERIQTEIQILQKLSHPLIVNMKEVVESEEGVYIILEYVKGGELTKRISSCNPLSEAGAKYLFYQMVLAVQYLHTNGITHRDLKPGNVLLSTRGSETLVKVADFGLSKVSEDYFTMKTVCGTWHYIAPEILNPKITQYDNLVDVWSLGVILFYMLAKELPFQSNDKSRLACLILSGRYEMNTRSWCEVSSDAKDLVKKMLTVNPQKRITIDEILNHSWIVKDNLMQFRVKNLIENVQKDIAVDINTIVSPRAKKRREPHGIISGMKRIRLSSSPET